MSEKNNQLKELVFLTSLDAENCNRALNYLGFQKFTVVKDKASLELAKGTVLISFGSSIIVPAQILQQYEDGAYNVHAASPDYPGRDPHHWAIYDKVKRYGATAHIMTNKVDDGPIVDVEWFSVESETTPAKLLELANEAAFTILSRIGAKLQRGEPLLQHPNLQWGKNKRTRADFWEMCKISPFISQIEFEEKFRAFDGGAYNNLTLELYGNTFRIEKTVK